MNLVDPDGTKIYIGTYEFRDGALYNLKGEIETIDNIDDFTKRVYDAINEINSTSVGKDLITNLVDSDFSFFIRSSKDNQFVPSHGQGACAYATFETRKNDQSIIIGSGGTVHWNPAGKEILTENGLSNNPIINLSHELFHAEDAAFGLSDTREYNGLKKSEWQAVYNENRLRQELGLPLRQYYGRMVTPDGTLVGGYGPKLVSRGKPIRPYWY